MAVLGTVTGEKLKAGIAEGPQGRSEEQWQSWASVTQGWDSGGL